MFQVLGAQRSAFSVSPSSGKQKCKDFLEEMPVKDRGEREQVKVGRVFGRGAGLTPVKGGREGRVIGKKSLLLEHSSGTVSLRLMGSPRAVTAH